MENITGGCVGSDKKGKVRIKGKEKVFVYHLQQCERMAGISCLPDGVITISGHVGEDRP